VAAAAAATGPTCAADLGTGADPGAPAVSLDGLPAGHLRVLLDGLSIFEQHGLLLAGGYAFRAHEIVYRQSQDPDFATGNHEPLPDVDGVSSG
jgi:hypothetical protein